MCAESIRSATVALLALTATASAESLPAPAYRVGTFHLAAPQAQVMPLFTALGERAWAHGWEPRILSGATERGSAFTTTAHAGQTVTWIVIEYRPEAGRVSYARLAPDSSAGLVDVACSQSADGGTDVAVRYTLTPVTESGREFVKRFLSEAQYAQMIEHWRSSISAALEKSHQ